MKKTASLFWFFGLCFCFGIARAEEGSEKSTQIEKWMNEYIQSTPCGEDPNLRKTTARRREFVSLVQGCAAPLEVLFKWGQQWEETHERLVLSVCLPPLPASLDADQKVAFLKKHLIDNKKPIREGIRKALLSALVTQWSDSHRFVPTSDVFQREAREALFSQYKQHNNLTLQWAALLGDPRVLDKIEKCLAAVLRSPFEGTFPSEEEPGRWKEFQDRGCRDNDFSGPTGFESGLEMMKTALASFDATRAARSTRANQLMAQFRTHPGIPQPLKAKAMASRGNLY